MVIVKKTGPGLSQAKIATKYGASKVCATQNMGLYEHRSRFLNYTHEIRPEYYYGNTAEQYSFYRIPKALFTDAHFQGVSMEAKLLYGLMLDRMGLSVRNGWLDSDGKVYIFFTLEDALAMLGYGKDKAVRLFKELDDIGLIERRKQGQGRPTRIYVKNFILPADSGEGTSVPAAEEPLPQTSEKPKSALRYIPEVWTSEKPTLIRLIRIRLR